MTNRKELSKQCSIRRWANKLCKLEIPYEGSRNSPEAQFYEQIKALLRSNNKIEAIKLYREATNLGLKEAKDAVDSIEREMKKK